MWKEGESRVGKRKYRLPKQTEKQKQQQSINCKTQPNRESNTLQMGFSVTSRGRSPEKKINIFLFVMKNHKMIFWGRFVSGWESFLLGCFPQFFAVWMVQPTKSPTHSKAKSRKTSEPAKETKRQMLKSNKNWKREFFMFGKFSFMPPTDAQHEKPNEM